MPNLVIVPNLKENGFKPDVCMCWVVTLSPSLMIQTSGNLTVFKMKNIIQYLTYSFHIYCSY